MNDQGTRGYSAYKLAAELEIYADICQKDGLAYVPQLMREAAGRVRRLQCEVNGIDYIPVGSEPAGTARADRVYGCDRCYKPIALVGDLIPSDGICPWCRCDSSPGAPAVAALWRKDSYRDG